MMFPSFNRPTLIGFDFRKNHKSFRHSEAGQPGNFCFYQFTQFVYVFCAHMDQIIEPAAADTITLLTIDSAISVVQ